MKTYNWRHPRWLMPVCVELATLLSDRRLKLFKTVYKIGRKVTLAVSHKCFHVLFRYRTVYRRTVILNAKTKCSCLSTFLLVHIAIIYLFLSWNNTHIAVVVVLFPSGIQYLFNKKEFKNIVSVVGTCAGFLSFWTHSLAFEDSN